MSQSTYRAELAQRLLNGFVVIAASMWRFGALKQSTDSNLKDVAMPEPTRQSSQYMTPLECLGLFVKHRRLWLIPTVACAGLSLLYALFMTRYWQASQGLVVRDEASTSSVKQPGKFADLYEMRTFQETVLEVLKSQQVLSDTLRLVNDDSSEAPSATEIEKLRKRLSMSPPNGAEFGKTEVFYLSVKDPSRERAIALVATLCQQLGIRLGELRNERSQGLIDELRRQVDLARREHEVENQALEAFEAGIGTDLGELRLLHSATGGQSDLRQQMVEVEQEHRRTEERVREAEELLDVLAEAQQNPDKLIAIPSSLLSLQPTLQRLKDGLLDAQLQVTRLAGNRTTDHPFVKAARESVARARQELHSELQVAVQSLEVELGLSRNRLAVLQSQLESLQRRLGKLAKLRAEYSTLVAAAENSRGILGQLQRQFSEVQAQQVASQSSRLVTPFDQPETGPNPVGMGRTTVLALGTMAGFALGIAWLFLHVAVPQVDARQVQAFASAPQRASTAGAVSQTADEAAAQAFAPVEDTNGRASAMPATRPVEGVQAVKFDFSGFLDTAKAASEKAKTAVVNLTPASSDFLATSIESIAKGTKLPVGSKQNS